MRFGVSASTLHARHHPRYFGMRSGVSIYNHVSDQGSQFWVDVINCQLREATYVLDGLLYQDTLPIREHYTDTHGYTDLLFGLFEPARLSLRPPASGPARPSPIPGQAGHGLRTAQRRPPPHHQPRPHHRALG